MKIYIIKHLCNKEWEKEKNEIKFEMEQNNYIKKVNILVQFKKENKKKYLIDIIYINELIKEIIIKYKIAYNQYNIVKNELIEIIYKNIKIKKIFKTNIKNIIIIIRDIKDYIKRIKNNFNLIENYKEFLKNELINNLIKKLDNNINLNNEKNNLLKKENEKEIKKNINNNIHNCIKNNNNNKMKKFRKINNSVKIKIINKNNKEEIIIKKIKKYQKIKRNNFELINVIGDGNCFYRCMAKYEEDNEENYLKYKNEVFNYIISYKYDYLDNEIKKEFREFTWAGDLEISNIMEYLKKIIIILSTKKNYYELYNIYKKRIKIQ